MHAVDCVEVFAGSDIFDARKDAGCVAPVVGVGLGVVLNVLSFVEEGDVVVHSSGL